MMGCVSFSLQRQELHCLLPGSYRSAIATSILRKAGFKAQDVIGGFAAVSVYAPEHTTTGVVRM